MDIFDTPYYRFNKYLIGIIGHWPYQPPKQRRIQWIIVYLSIGTVILVQALKLVQIWGNIDLMVECIVPMGVQGVALLKATNCIVNAVKLKKLLDLMKEDWTGLTERKEIKVLTDYVERGRFIGSSYAVYLFCSMTIYLTIPLMPQILDVVLPLNETRPRQFLYLVEYYVNSDDYYVTIMIHNYVGTLFTIITIVSVDILLIAYIHHVCGMFTIVGNRLENSVINSDDNVPSDLDISSDKFYRRIANCMKKHGEILEFARVIEVAHSMTILFQIGTAMLLVSATGLQVVAKLGNANEVFRIVPLVLGQLIFIYFNSLPSQMLIDHTQRFRDSVYFAEWYRFPMCARHLIRLAMMRSLKPCKMTAGTLYDMSMESFAKVVQTSMSYFTVLVSLR